MKIAYYTHESITSGLFRTQVIDAILAASSEDINKEYTIFVYNYFWLLLKNLKLVKKLRNNLSKSGIRIRFFPLLIPIKYSMSSYFYFQSLKCFFRLVIFFTYHRDTHVHHCRGYLLTYALTKNGLLSVIFDMRSLWVLENISAGNLKTDTLLCSLWFELEKQCLRGSCANVGVSPAMGKYVAKISRNVDFCLIPISVAAEKFRFDQSLRNQIRFDHGWHDSLVVVYSGSLGLSRINAEALKILLTTLKLKMPDLKCVVGSQEPKDLFVDIFRDACFETTDYLLTSETKISLSGILSVADFGVHALPEQLDSETRLGTKVVEYLINGLPIIVNKHVGDAARIVRKYKLGYVLEDMTDNDFDEIQRAKHKYRRHQSQASRNFAMNTFASNVTAKQYNNVYDHVFEKSGNPYG